MFNNGTFTAPEYRRYSSRAKAAVTYCPNVGTLVIAGFNDIGVYILTQPQAWGDNKNIVRLASVKSGTGSDAIATTYENRVYTSCAYEEYRIEMIDFSEVTNAEEDSNFLEYVFNE